MVNKCPAVGAGGGRMGAIEFDLCIGDIERSNVQVARKRSKVRGKKVRAHPHIRNRDVATSHLMVVVRSLFGEPLRFTSGIQRKNILSNVHYGSTSPFSPISTNPSQLTTWRQSHVLTQKILTYA